MVKLKDAVRRKALAKMREVADFVFSRSQENLVRNGSSNTGSLLQSGRVEDIPNGARVIYDEPYASYVEYGTYPHFPPLAPLAQWAQKKLNLSKREATSASYAIARKIARDGTSPQPFLRPAVQTAGIRFGFDPLKAKTRQ